MVKIIVYSALVMLLFSCKKEPITPGNYTTTPAPIDTSHWQYQYSNGGTLPTWTTSTTANDLFGTNWIVTEVTTPWPIVTTNPMDTVHFIDNAHYKVGYNGVVNAYTFFTNTSGSTLTMNSFVTINSLNFTCNNVTYNSFTNVNVGGTVILKLKNVLIMTDIYTTVFKKI
jgi:hypothetical protein